METDYTTYLVCPHCGQEHQDSWEIMGDMSDGDVDETDCEKCDKPFKFTVHVSVNYSTEKKP